MRTPFSAYQFLLLLFILILVVIIIQVGAFTIALDKLGLSTHSAMLLLACTLMGSAINLPLFSIQAEEPSDEARRMFRGLLFGRPMPFTGRTIIAVNVGGALIPVSFSVYLVMTNQLPLIQVIPAIAIVTLCCRIFSRPIPGLGIGIPVFIAPVTAAVTALLLAPENSAPMAYICGTLGVLIGADLMRLPDIRKLGTPVASIGGAGTFDGIFFTGIVAVLLA
ncbi:MAG: DUF1614 domain-containing protein [Gammaproteobacteria bacterium]|nr:DUF1614 domain-containing protein [Gammaproteobacteria bacterium]